VAGFFNEASEMNNSTVCTAILPLLATAFLSFPAQADVKADPEAAIAAVDGLALVEKDGWGEIYANPAVDWSVYTQIQLEDATVAFRRHWQRDQNRGDPFKVKNSDVENIKRELSEQFREVFTEELTQNGGYVMSDVAGENVLMIKPSIVDLNIAAPDTMRSYRSRQYTESSGEMTLKLELYDSVTGDLLATASDRKESIYRGYLQWTTGVSNRADSHRMLQQWAQSLRERLDTARSAKPPAIAADAN
jgi:Protein of unknown function (DUF3313)